MLRKPVIRDIIILSLFIVVTLLALTQVPRIQIDGSIDAFFPVNHPVIEVNEEIEDTFGSLDSFMVTATVTFGTVLEPEVLSLYDRITSELESDDAVESVTSIVNIDYVKISDDQMTVLPLIDSDAAPMGDTQIDGTHVADVLAAKRRIADWQEAYIGTVISADLKTAAFVVQPRTDASAQDLSRIYGKIRTISDTYSSPNIRFRIAGAQVFEEEIARNVSSDVQFLIPAAALLIILVLAISFRRLLGVFCTILSIAVAGIWVVGVIGILGITLTMATLLVPVLLLVVGSAYGIHVMQHFYEDMSHEKGHVSYDRVREIVRNGIGAIRSPVILAGLTTAAGFLAQLTSPLGPFRVFGVLSAVGVGAALLTSLVLIPVILRLLYRNGMEAGKSRRAASEEKKDSRQRRFPDVLIRLVKNGKPGIVLFSLLLIVATVLAVPEIKVGTNVANFFRPSGRVSSDARAINNILGGTGIISVEIKSPQPGDILEPDFLRNVETFETYLTDRYPAVTGVRTLIPSIKRMNSILNYDTVPYSVTEEDTGSFDFFGGDFFGTSDSDENTIAANGDTESSDSAPTGFGFEQGFGGDPEITALSYDDMAALLEAAILDAGIGANAGDIVHEFLRANNYHGAAFNEIPADPAKYGLETDDDLRNLLTQYLVLYSGNLSMFINDALEPDRTLLTVQINDENRDILLSLRRDIRAYWDYYLPDDWDMSIGGPSTLVLVLSELVTRSQYLSLIGALIIVWGIVAITFKSPVAGFYGLIPVAFALVGIFLSMAAFGFYLDVVTSILAALAIGVGVDYGIHLMSAYRRSLVAGKPDPLDAVYRTTGSAILFNAASVAIGFLSLLASQFVPIRQVGILFTVSMIFAGGSSLIVLPMTLEYFTPRFITRGITTSRNNNTNRRNNETDDDRITDAPAAAASGSPGGNGRGDHATRNRQPEDR